MSVSLNNQKAGGTRTALYRRLAGLDVPFGSGIRGSGSWRYIMCEAPDSVLLERYFSVD